MKKICFLLPLLAAVSCEILEEDISNRSVEIIAPADRTTAVAGNIDFHWTAMEYAVGYELTVVSPSFATAERVALDTVIYADTLSRRFHCRIPLSEGEYQWRINGFDAGYSSKRTTRNLTVIAADEPQTPDEPEL